MAGELFLDAALVLVGHGSTRNHQSGAPIYQLAESLRQGRHFAGVYAGFWGQEPKIEAVLEGVSEARVFIAPVLTSEGLVAEHKLPGALGFEVGEQGVQGRARRRGSQWVYYCRAVGTHPSMTRVILARAAEIVACYPFPQAPPAKETALFIAGHGTGRDDNSRQAIEQHVGVIRAQQQYAQVTGVFLEEEPHLGDCYRLSVVGNLVVVPFFISEGLHVQEDIPVLLGENRLTVQQRLQNHLATWRNPTQKHGKRVWLAAGIGNEPELVDVILERVRETCSATGESAKA